ncbi:MAG TPA: MBL fold metallo-hydrolase [Candidatus Paceibacterota bacterium]|nr:MBL fold metallo-hydrolase [Candidatus Paceibacterota bacterium]
MAEIKITFLGTGPSGRIPRPGCERPSCRDARQPGSKSRRLQQSLMISSAGTALLFDISEDVREQWRHADGIRHIDAAFISHPHNDAYGGLVHIRDVLRGLGQESLAVYAERATWDRAEEEFSPLDHLNRRAMTLHEPVSAGPFSVLPFRVDHTPDPETHPTAGFHISKPERNIVLITDVKTIPEGSYGIIGQPDLLILDCAIFETIYENAYVSHVNFAEALKIAARIRPKRTILTQIGVTWPPYDEARKLAEGHGVDIAYDGREVVL